ncbi:2-keto-4-pentenoate hydratase/2-oxohepta-3-ene-1,7-dioic acid hydratase in catechol pathway [Bradyrhizobium sp. LM2.9]
MRASSASSSARPAPASRRRKQTASSSATPASTTSPANDILTSDPTFPQWARAKGIDDYGPFGPVIATGLDPAKLVVRTILNGAERQNYPISDMIFTAQELVSKISHDMTLLPGDLIAVGTSVGVGVMKEPVNTVTVAIDGIGELTNEFRL